MKPCFIKIRNFWAWVDNLGRLEKGHLGYCPCFPLINHFFYKKVSLYMQIVNIYLGLGLGFEFEFGPQRIWDLAIVCP